MNCPTAIFRGLLFATIATAALGAHPAEAETQFGRFVGKFVAEFTGDGRKVTLMEPFGYVDPSGLEWNVPEGYKTDGASVPAALWALYPPFTGTYRSAAVIHDYYCDNKERSWQDTHKAFYFAMRAANVAENTAKIMYSAVYLFGPRWGLGTRAGQRNARVEATPEQQAEVVKKLEALVESENPDLDRLVAEAKRISVTTKKAE
ncbi:MAG TPA: DUF1353 domain-containing protein [Methyloceanibacter sp.]|nr:DUF1353 domain-containing protein [Methyloceanibacter sp.]